MEGLSLKVETLRTERDTAEEQVKNKSKAMATLQVEKEDLISNISKLESSAESLTSDLAAANEQVSVLMSRSKDTEDALSSQKSVKDELESCLENTKADIARIKTEKEETIVKWNAFQASVKSKDDEITSLTSKLATADTQLTNLRDKLAANLAANDELATVRDHFQALAAKLAVNILQLKMKSKKSTDKVHQLEKEKKAELNTQTEALEEMITGLEKSVSAKDEEIHQLNAKIMNNTGLFKDLHRQNDQLSSQREGHSILVDQLRTENEALMEVEVNLQVERKAASTLKDQLKQAEDTLLELQASKLCLENRLEEVLQDKSHLSSEVNDMHDTIATLETGKEALASSLQDYKEKTVRMSTQVTVLENQARSNAQHIISIESQLSAKFKEVEVLNKTINSHEVTMVNFRNQMQSIDKEKLSLEGTLSSLHSRMDRVIGERDDLTFQLVKAMKDLNSVREERKKLVTIQNPSNHEVTDQDVTYSCEVEMARNNETTQPDVTPQNSISEILTASCISEREVSFVVDKMENVRTVISQIEQERKVLRKEAKQLRASLERAQGELTTAKKEYNKVNHQTVAMRSVVSQASTLLEKAEEEKNQLSSELKNAQATIKRLQLTSSLSYNAIIALNEDEIKELKKELKEKNEAVRLLSTSTGVENTDVNINNTMENHHKPNDIAQYDISQYDVIAYEATATPSQRVIGSSRAAAPKDASEIFNNHCANPSSIGPSSRASASKVTSERVNNHLAKPNPPITPSPKATPTVKAQVTSKERFKLVEKQSMFGLLKDINKSGRKKRVKYRDSNDAESKR